MSPKLIPLLRGLVELLPVHDDREPYDLTAATRVAVGLLICGPLWVLILWVLGITLA